jgi:tetratricopeptide (TPR) repeat protein
MGHRSAFEEAMRRGHNYAWAGEWDKAIEEYRRAVHEFPEDPVAHSSLGLALLEAGRLREALGEYRIAGKLRPDDLAARRRVAEICSDLGRVTEAAEAWESLALLYEKRGAVDEALEAWQEVARSKPESEKALEELAEAHIFEAPEDAVQEYLALARLAQAKGERGKAVEHCRRALTLDEGNVEAQELVRALAGAPAREGYSPAAIAAREARTRLAGSILGEAREEAHPGVVALGRAMDLEDKGMVEEAIEEYELALKEGVTRGEVLFNLSLLYAERGRCDQLLSLFKDLVGTEYELAGRFLLGKCYLGEREGREALMHLLEALKMVDPMTPREGLTQAYEEILYEDGKRAHLLADRLVDFFESEGWEEKVTSLRERVEKISLQGLTISLAELLEHPEFEGLLASMALVDGYWKQGVPLMAVEECYRLLERAPDHLLLHLYLGEIFLRQGKVDEVVEKYRAVGRAYAMRGAPRRAIAVYRMATSLAPMDVEIPKRLVELLIGLGEIDRALEEYLALAEAYYRLARPGEAVETYGAALKLAPQSDSPQEWKVRLLRRRADLLMQRAGWGEALVDYEELRRLVPDDEEAWRALVDLYFRLGRREEALEEINSFVQERGEKAVPILQDMIRERAQDMGLRQRLGEAYLSLGMKGEAIAELDALGELQLEAGLEEEARETIQRIISLGPEDIEAYRQLLEQLGGS